MKQVSSFGPAMYNPSLFLQGEGAKLYFQSIKDMGPIVQGFEISKKDLL